MHESKALSVKAKIQGLVMIRPPSTGELQVLYSIVGVNWKLQYMSV